VKPITNSKAKATMEPINKKYNECHKKMMKAYETYEKRNSVAALNKYFVLREKCMKIENEFSNADTSKKLTEKEVKEILESSNFIEEEYLEEDDDYKEYQKVKRQLMNLTYDPKYKSAFTGEPTRNLYEMASDKIAAYTKYGYEIDE